MEIQTERTFVIRMTRLEAARTLVAPAKLLSDLRERLSAEPSDSETIDGTVPQQIAGPSINQPLLIAGGGGRSPLVRKALQKLRKGSRKSICPHCGRRFRGLNVHIVKSHPGVPQIPAGEPE